MPEMAVSRPSSIFRNRGGSRFRTACENRTAAMQESLDIQAIDMSAGLPDQQYPCLGVPGIEMRLVERFGSSAGDLHQAASRRSCVSKFHPVVHHGIQKRQVAVPG